jgi:hypothetical protein
METWQERRMALEASFDSRRERAFWVSTFEEARKDWHSAQAWDFPWIYSCWTKGGLSTMPSVNLVENLGFGPDATHTKTPTSHLRVPAGRFTANRHPKRIARNILRDDMMFRTYAGEEIDWRSNIHGALRVLGNRLTSPAR